MNDVRYYQDHDHRELIVRVWHDEKGVFHGEYWWLGKSDKWSEADKLARMVADEIYDHHPLSYSDVEKLIKGL